MEPMDSGQTEDGVLYRTGCHWAMLLGPALLVVIGGLALRSQGYGAAALILFGAIWGFFAHRSLRGSEIRLTRERVLIDAGFPLVKSYDIPLGRIAAIDFYQPALGSMLNFGRIMINRVGARRCSVGFVSDPGELVMKVRQQIAALGAPRGKE